MAESSLVKRLGERVKVARNRLELTQEQVAERLGVPRSAVSDIESGKRELSAAEVVSLALLFGESVESLLDIAEPGHGNEEVMFRAESIPTSARAQLETWMRL